MPLPQGVPGETGEPEQERPQDAGPGEDAHGEASQKDAEDNGFHIRFLGIRMDEKDVKEISIEEMEVMPDHIHMLISFKPKYAPSDIVKYLKGHSAKQFFEKHPEIRDHEFWGGHLWSHSYYMSTLGNMSKEVVEQYIRNQYTK